MDELEHRKLVVALINAKSEVQARVASVDDFVGSEFEEVGHLGVTRNYHAVRLGLNARSLIFIVGDVPPGKTSLTLSILEEDESNL